MMLQKHEQFEIEVLKKLSDGHFLDSLIFGGGTCLRLCFGLNRYSLDLDFWLKKSLQESFFQKMKKNLEEVYTITDFHGKYFSYLLELKSTLYPQKLKIEIRKTEAAGMETELNIAFSPSTPWQIKLTTFSLSQMWKNKIAAFLERKDIRDAYDLEFIYKRGSADIQNLDAGKKKHILALLDMFQPKDFAATLGSLLEAKEREYYRAHGFKILKNAFRD